MHVPFAKYLENTASGRLSHDLKWILINRRLETGPVTITPYNYQGFYKKKSSICIVSLRPIKNLSCFRIQNHIDK